MCPSGRMLTCYLHDRVDADSHTEEAAAIDLLDLVNGHVASLHSGVGLPASMPKAHPADVQDRSAVGRLVAGRTQDLPKKNG